MRSVVLADDGLHIAVRTRRPTDKQRIVLESKAKRKIIRAGRRGGKTTGAAILALDTFFDGGRVLYAVPVADQIRVFWREINNAVAPLIASGRLYKNESEHILEFPGTKQRIRCKTAYNADTLRGDFADLLILDEWQLMDESAWEEVGAPMLADNNGDAVFIYTPPSLRSRSMSKARDPRHAAKMFRSAMLNPDKWLSIHWTSRDNPHISQEAVEELRQDMTSLAYRQEIEAEDIEEVPGALWTREVLDKTRVDPNTVPAMKRIVVGIDPSGSTVNEAGVVAAGMGVDGHVYVLRDRSLLAAQPTAWAAAAIMVYDELQADLIAGERNYGGDMVEMTIRSIDSRVAYKDVQATRSKIVRAEPISTLYFRDAGNRYGFIHHVGQFPELEEELCTYVPGASKSPNRMDALVWAVTELSFGLKFGILDYYKEKVQQQGERIAPGIRVIKPPDPLTIQEQAKASRDGFDRAISRK